MDQVTLGVAGLSHETHTFLPQSTGIEPFERDAVRGDSILRTFEATNSSIGGLLDVCGAAGIDVDLVPTVHTRGGVSGTVTDEVYDTYAAELCDGFAEADLDGVFLFLHGAMVTESYRDPETRLVRAVREVVGEIPIVVAMDLHGNIGHELTTTASAVCAYRSSPHVDKRHTGMRAARILLDTATGDVAPVTAVAKPGLVVPSVFSATTVSPARDIVSRAITWQHQPELLDVTRWTEREDVLDVSFFFGFAWSDVPQIGVAPVAVTDDNPELGQRIVDDLAEFAWEYRTELTSPDHLYSVEDGVSYAQSRAETAENPIIILDHADRLAETTFVLRELVERRASGAAAPLLWDPEAVEVCQEAGEGNGVTVRVGSKTSDHGGGPVELAGTVEFVGERTYTATGPMNRGERVSHGPTAIVRTDDDIWVQLTTKMQTALTDTDPFDQYGYDPTTFDIIVTKSKTHFRAVFEELADEIVIVDAPEYSPADLSGYDFANVPDGVYPITRES